MTRRPNDDSSQRRDIPTTSQSRRVVSHRIGHAEKSCPVVEYSACSVDQFLFSRVTTETSQYAVFTKLIAIDDL